ncbi:hypothetical protein [Nakamurella endophytica]|uniref:Uncharacterized protein n=1 Tax=Nakamurella endophytica TaxID=1748367 RepID=A0A917WFY2_9ACTN|nr:hypothetical protein [Nakamurella endophytica]GGM00573.1 hypothetical protein GCM10011594_20860 [Nakamurella endophytica]
MAACSSASGRPRRRWAAGARAVARNRRAQLVVALVTGAVLGTGLGAVLAGGADGAGGPGADRPVGQVHPVGPGHRGPWGVHR